MIEKNATILQAAALKAEKLISTGLSEQIKFHTLQHTKEVVAACEKIASTLTLAEEDLLALFIAAWFHDTGYTTNIASDHETASINYANQFLVSHTISDAIITKVTGCINATRMPQQPLTTIEKIICDADLFHLGTEAFKEKNKLLKEERMLLTKSVISKKEWQQENIDFLSSHHFFTAYGKEQLEPVKQKHLLKLKEKIETQIPDIKKSNKEKKKDNSRSISTIFRIIAQNQNNLSQMADSKANILISVNSIILTIVISTLFTKLENNSNLQIPVIILVSVCVTAIVFSILATRPTIINGTFTEEDIRNKKTNLLFFGNFYKMSLPDYNWAMLEMFNDKHYLYSSIVKDNYFLGVVLAKKYRFLRIAYNVFMFGIIIAMLAFAIAIAIPQIGEVYVPG